MKTLYLMRHAKAGAKHTDVLDFDRELTAEGAADAASMIPIMQQFQIDAICVSSAVRCQQTATLAGLAPFETYDELYHESADRVRQFLSRMPVYPINPPKLDSIMLVGHNPAFEEFVFELTGIDQKVKKAGIVQLSLPIDAWGDIVGDTQGTLINTWKP